ncbi:hypothetical protein [Aestuariibius sp. HNIBRBA575]|uniref:hypothetical protein n=1 Tax=Aestuariibius sp. HNIBRBA575 TaxID=3233343 RepID=UPI0034A1C54D
MRHKADKKKLATLHRLADAHYTKIQSQMSILNSREAELNTLLGQLQMSISGRAATIDIETDASVFSGADPLWEGWVQARRTEINQQIYAIRVEKQNLQLQLSKSFGRTEVLKNLRQKSSNRQWVSE